MTKSRPSIINTYAPLIAPSLLLLFLLITSIRPISLGYNLYNDKRILEIIFLALINLSGLLIPSLRQQTICLWQCLPRLSQWGISAFFCLGFISATLSEHPLFALADAALHLNLVIAALIFAGSYSLIPDKLLKLTATGIFALICSSIFTELIGMIVYLNTGKAPGSAELFSYFTHPRFFNQLQSWLLPAVFLLPAAWPNKNSTWFLSTIAGAFWIALMLISGGRGSSLGIVTAFICINGLYLYIKFRYPDKPSTLKLLISFALVLLGGLTLYTLFIFIPSWLGIDTSVAVDNSIGRNLTTFNGRIEIWGAALQGASEFPFFGVGPGLYSCLTGADWYPAHPHSGYLQILGEWGPTAGVLFFVLALSGVMAVIEKIISTNKLTGWVLLISVFAAAVHMSLSGLWVMPAAQISGVLICGLTLGWVVEKIPATSHSENKPGFLGPILIAVLLLSQLLITFYLYQSIPQLKRIDQTTSNENNAIQSPGFWFEGLICRNGAQHPDDT